MKTIQQRLILIITLLTGQCVVAQQEYSVYYRYLESHGKVCSPYHENLKKFMAPWSQMRSERKIAPGMKAFDKPTWKRLDKRQYTQISQQLIKQFDNHNLQQATDNQLEAWLNQSRYLYSTHIDIDNDGTVETVLRYEYQLSGASQFYANALVVVDDKIQHLDLEATQHLLQNPLTDHQNPAGRWIYAMYDLFLYQGEVYFDKWHDEINKQNTLSVFKTEGGTTKKVCTIEYELSKSLDYSIENTPIDETILIKLDGWHQLSKQQYDNKRYQFFQRLDGSSLQAQLDMIGKPIIGLGFDLQRDFDTVLTDLGFDLTHPLEQPYLKEIKKVIHGTFHSSHALQSALNAIMRQRANHLNKQGIKSAKSTFAYQNDQEIQTTFDKLIAPVYENQLDNWLAVAVNDSHQDNAEMSPLPLSNERIALLSLLSPHQDIQPIVLSLDLRRLLKDNRHLKSCYEIPQLYFIFPYQKEPPLLSTELVEALKKNHRAQAWYLIRYHTNRFFKEAGITKRRLATAALFGLYDDVLEDSPHFQEQAREIWGMLENKPHKFLRYGRIIDKAKDKEKWAEFEDEIDKNRVKIQPYEYHLMAEIMKAKKDFAGLVNIEPFEQDIKATKTVLQQRYTQGIEFERVFTDLYPENTIDAREPTVIKLSDTDRIHTPSYKHDRYGVEENEVIEIDYLTTIYLVYKKDLILGGDGDDTLWAGEGNDYLYGENDNDVLHGGQGDDIYFGGQGDDLMIDTDGKHDVYHYKTGEGHDIISDADAQGKVIFDDTQLTEAIETKPGSGIYQNGHFRYSRQDSDLVINDTLTIKNFNFNEDGYLGITLIEAEKL
ncbi:MAG: hypothetical protein DRR00_24235 [Candidatus Parabeggiatoa sp. nov. 3]|nr:MAG: hypothetical protein DRR00_24235 [Gammaproteobacteria bacterium]RKZ60272.1 MAG: hypothetical protein DRQ99_22340 [Gammaproteobacteria bacterium]